MIEGNIYYTGTFCSKMCTGIHKSVLFISLQTLCKSNDLCMGKKQQGKSIINGHVILSQRADCCFRFCGVTPSICIIKPLRFETGRKTYIAGASFLFFPSAVLLWGVQAHAIVQHSAVHPIAVHYFMDRCHSTVCASTICTFNRGAQITYPILSF